MEQNKIAKKLFINCKEAGFLTTIKESEGLSTWQQTQLKFHNVLCKVCKRWEQQSAQINNIIKKAFTHQHFSMPEERKELIKKELDQLLF